MYEWQQEIKGRPSSITCIRYLTPPMQWETIRKMLCEDNSGGAPGGESMQYGK